MLILLIGDTAGPSIPLAQGQVWKCGSQHKKCLSSLSYLHYFVLLYFYVCQMDRCLYQIWQFRHQRKLCLWTWRIIMVTPWTSSWPPHHQPGHSRHRLYLPVSWITLSLTSTCSIWKTTINLGPQSTEPRSLRPMGLQTTKRPLMRLYHILQETLPAWMKSKPNRHTIKQLLFLLCHSALIQKHIYMFQMLQDSLFVWVKRCYAAMYIHTHPVAFSGTSREKLNSAEMASTWWNGDCNQGTRQKRDRSESWFPEL